MYRLIAVLIGGMLALSTQPAQSQSYPSETIRIIVPFAPGGNVDVTARLVAPAMSELLGQPVVVENRTGAGGLVGTAAALGAKPDGYTLLMGSTGTLTVGPNTFPNWPHDPIKGITPISNIQFVPLALVVKADSPIKSVQDLVRLTREKPDEIVAAGAGLGTANHLAAELFQMLTGTKRLLVSYRGAAPAMNDLIAGHVHWFFDQASTTVPQVQGGTIRALAVTSPKRWPSLPDTPTFTELGLEKLQVLNVCGLVGPAGLDPRIVERLRDATVKALANPAVRDGFAKLGVEIDGSDPQTFAAFIKEDLERWARIIAEGKVKVQ
jgi:tripartite-type tricarboxylate transporter receptor subunit TctC